MGRRKKMKMRDLPPGGDVFVNAVETLMFMACKVLTGLLHAMLLLLGLTKEKPCRNHDPHSNSCAGRDSGRLRLSDRRPDSHRET